MKKHTEGKVDNSVSWCGETSEAGIDHDGHSDIYSARSFVRHTDDGIDFTITVEAEGLSQDDAGDQAMTDINRVAALWNAAAGMSTEEAVSLLNGTHLEDTNK